MLEDQVIWISFGCTSPENLWKINISPEKAQFQRNISSSNHLLFSGYVSFRGSTIGIRREEHPKKNLTSRIREFFTENTLPKICRYAVHRPSKKRQIYVPKRNSKDFVLPSIVQVLKNCSFFWSCILQPNLGAAFQPSTRHKTRWLFQRLFISTPMPGGNDPIWRIFFRGVETTSTN